MKSHELANILELTSKILRSLPNNDIVQNINYIQKLINASAKRQVQESRDHTIALPRDIEVKLQTMSAQEVEEYLTNDALFVSTASIQKLAHVLDIQTSKRQSRSALINLIVRHHEATQMDAIIRSGSKPEKDTV